MAVIRVIVIFMLMFVLDLGDDPPRDRTAELRVLGFPRRHLGSVQMTTDTALGVTKRVVEDRGSCLLSPDKPETRLTALTVPLEQIPYVVRSPDPVPLWSLNFLFQDYPTIRFNAHESVEMPFRASSLMTDATYRDTFSGYMIAPGTKDEPLLPPGMKAHLHAELNESIDFA